MFLNTVLVVLTDLAARLLGNTVFRQHFHLLLSAVVMFSPALSFWVSQHSIFAKRSHFLYRIFLRSGWGWTCVFVGSFVFLLSFSIRRSLALSIRHLSRLGVAGALWFIFCKLLDQLENATGSCYESLITDAGDTNGQPLLVLREGESKSECLKAGMLWRGYEVSEDVFLLCLCCLLLAEEMAVFGPYLSLGGISDAPLRILFLFCVLLLGLWIFLLFCLLAYFPQFPTQLLGGALGCLSWRGLYQGWYRLGPSWYCPGRPGVGLLKTKTGGAEAEDAQLNHDHYN
ncbi:fat storage-inducing transmembrane protein 1-like [Seriola dumerili]|uniref:Fat storage-inducing transmembrane protein 1 homolog n=1 Tax=Seriola dumerili TaxID=41447 RepID=A0A3B4U963_SERDU|nr:fat storage-inducing transmembrane protein 1-like [Seriola dumerili]